MQGLGREVGGKRGGCSESREEEWRRESETEAVEEAAVGVGRGGARQVKAAAQRWHVFQQRRGRVEREGGRDRKRESSAEAQTQQKRGSVPSQPALLYALHPGSPALVVPCRGCGAVAVVQVWC